MALENAIIAPASFNQFCQEILSDHLSVGFYQDAAGRWIVVPLSACKKTISQFSTPRLIYEGFFIKRTGKVPENLKIKDINPKTTFSVDFSKNPPIVIKNVVSCTIV